ncbi:permease [Flavobacterium limnosediminis JC2902]|uniref:Permease n=1 Tax=Flavobacterium limnosediminis JC2902 TaxID=1341181 RepID=V6SUX3_9FLAO|nr:AI-2E family transporter [Flavobacterium limnosediminis]ESU28210.1 permease [Flavobacterium limnosediminis JC2902]
MTSKDISNGILGAIFKLTGIAILIYVLYLIKAVLIYILISLILTMIGNPIVEFLTRKLKLKKNIVAVILTMLFYILLISGFILLFIPLFISQGENLSLLNTDELRTDFFNLFDQLIAFLEANNINADEVYKKLNIPSKLNFEVITSFLNSLINVLSSFSVGLASVIFITFFFLKDRHLFEILFKKIIPDRHEDKILISIEKINHLLSRYFIGILLQLLIVFVMYLIVLLIVGIDNALTIAFICAILNIIPYIGPLIGNVFAVLLTMLSFAGADFATVILPNSIYVMIGFFIVQLIDNNISQPYIFSNSVNSHPLEIFLVILMGGYLFGISGMILAVPAYTALKVIGKEFIPENKIIQILTKNI